MLPTNYSQAKLFDKKFVALTLKDARHCDKCKRKFDTKFRCSVVDSKPNSSRPVLLNCGHNICENCIYQNRNNITCAVCTKPIVLENTRWLKKSYDLNYCLLGQLINAASFLTSETSVGAIASTGMLAQELVTHKCGECEQAPAIGICMHCKVDFCKRCFSSVHHNSKVLKKHKLSEFEVQTLQLKLPKEKICKAHKRICDKFCIDCQGMFCLQCVRHIHGSHHVVPLSIENANQKDKIISFLETMKQTREHLRNAQKEVRIRESRLEEYATQVVLEINDFFLELQNFLQLEERRILDEFKKKALSTQKAIHKTITKLSDSQTTLNNMRSTLEGYIHKPPNEFHINAVIELATVQLEQIPCQIEISDIEKNPFVFKKLKDVRKELKKSYEIVGKEPNLKIRIYPMFGNESNSFEISSEEIRIDDLRTMSNMDLSETIPQNATTSTVALMKTKQTVRVTNIISPVQFYTQDENAIKEIKKRLTDVNENSGFVESVKIGEMYIAYQAANKSWLRVVVKEESKASKNSKDAENIQYKVMLLDYGIFEDIQKKCFRQISEKIKSIPPAAVLCSLIDVAPRNNNWSSDGRELMEEIIQNKPVQMIVHDKSKSPWNVELFTSNHGEPLAMRDVLLYTGIAIDSSSKGSASSKPTPISKMKQRLSRQILQPGEFCRVHFAHIENPQRFFVIKFSQLEDLKSLESEMDSEYSREKSKTIYYGQLFMCCALNFDGKWYRGSIEEVNGPNNILVRLVDDGRSVTVNWYQLHILKERFTKNLEFSIECSLADIQPLQENNYEWTETAIAEFVRMTSNPNIQMIVSSSNNFRYNVILNVLKKHLDINIGAMLVKFKHALTTGEGSAIVENTRNTKMTMEQLLIPEDTKRERTGSTAAALRTLKRTPIQIVHINNPGEFYIYLVEHIPGILKFHEELQLAMELKKQIEDTVEDINWNINDHCMIHTSLKCSPSKQWYRGVIKEIDPDEPEKFYTIFLRDKGKTVSRVHPSQLAPICDAFNRVVNAAILCHLACVCPTGGIETWSHSSIDEFTHNVSSFESLGATIQGDPKNLSIPVVLWGMMTETNDPLAPCTTKFTNINKALVTAGLAHLSEKIDITRHMDEFVQAELKKGQQTLQEWYENFKKTLEDLPICTEEIEELDEEKSHITTCDLSDSIENSQIATEWLPAEPIEKTVFTGYPTYIDDEAIVYVHDSTKHSLLNKMRHKINEIVESKKQNSNENQQFIIGQPCLARYHLDKMLYRAIIHRILDNKKYEVRFIDYGNVEICEESELYRVTAFPNIPIQAVRFRIDEIKPNGDQEQYQTHVLDLIHGLIVDKLCGFRVANGEENKEIKKCAIRFGSKDLASYLIESGFVSGIGNKKYYNKSNQRKKIVPIEKPNETIDLESNDSEDELREFIKQKITDPTEPLDDIEQSPIKFKEDETTAIFNPDEYKKIFEKMQTEKLYMSVNDGDSEFFRMVQDTSPDSLGDDTDDDQVEFSFKSNYLQGDDNTESAPPMPRSAESSNFENFDPFDSSSLLSNFSGIEAFTAPQLPSSVKTFYCHVAYARSSTVLHIFPHLSELEYREIELSRRIQLIARKNQKLTTFAPKTPCLARYSKDKLWYRAIIRSHNASTRLVKVFYVDFLNTEQVSEENVRRCSNDLLTWPLRTFEMKLFGVKPNPRVREKDVKQEVKKCLGGRKLYTKIVRERGKTTEICLYNSKADKNVLAYEDLITNKFFCKD